MSHQTRWSGTHNNVTRATGTALRITTNTKIRLITRIALGFESPDALIAMAMLSLGGHPPALPHRK